MTRRRRLFVPFLMAAGLAAATETASAQVAKATAAAETKQQVDARYAKLQVDLERRHIADLARVAAASTGREADEAYRDVFNLAIAHDLYLDAQPAAKAAIVSGKHGPDVEALAHLVNIIVEAEQGRPDASLTLLTQFLESRAKAVGDDVQKLDTGTRLAIGEAYFERLVRSGRFDVAEKAAQLVVDKSKDPAVKEHFAGRLARLKRVGKPAPAASGTDVEGKAVSLADYKGKVVLVDFWATWCPPCGPELLRFNALAAKYASQGFVVLGVNEDSQGEGAAAKLDEIRAEVRHYLIGRRVSVPTLIDVAGDKGIAAAFGVDDIPANFLVGRDGTIIGFELGGAGLEAAIAKALGNPAK